MSTKRYISAKYMILAKTIKQPSGCWFWQGSLNTGYGEVHKNYWGKFYGVTRAHQLSYIVYNGNYDRDLLILHSCNNKQCVNPKHLRCGTHKDNAQDYMNTGKFISYFSTSKWNHNEMCVKGEDVGTSKLTETQIFEIRELLKAGNLLQREIGALYGVHQVTISKLKHNLRWRHV